MAAEHPRITDDGVSFGKSYAVLNLDLMAILIDAVKDTAKGQAFISSCTRWNDAVHKIHPRPPVIFTTLSFSPGEPELAEDAPFGKIIRNFGSFIAGSSAVQIASNFEVDSKDIVLQKTRCYGGTGNSLEQILKARNIDTVIISGLSLSGVVMSTIYRLFDLDYNIYVISDNVLELPLDQHQEYSRVMLGSLLPKMNLRVISVDSALRAVERSLVDCGPVIN
ncbi:Isochorismatase hydrolase [Daldinia caldariorum]|uniref:Isochorismatase hydrolase n=1 Tax=Daldinia caldariorum TaxID=326644 RepID=UPI0020075F8B|nr:Isochorismatase hydrolase [Daldinia caldariorum]KAI1472168.1 Isochorismatase hydrolase [Daldinia caldariorum]